MLKSRTLLCLAGLSLACGWVTVSRAADICEATALRDVAAIDNPDSILKKGAKDEAITEFRVNTTTGETSYCSHGGYCYPTHVHVGDDLLLALKMTNCSPSTKPLPAEYSDRGEINYEVEVIRSRISAAALRRDDIENRMLALGLCSACADNVAQYYVTEPKSRCAELARSALEGNPDAVTTLQGGPDYCTYHYPEEK